MEKKWTKQKLIFIPVALLVFIAYISVTFNDPKGEQYDTSSAEGKLEQTLSQIQGVGQVKVYFHYDENTTKTSGDSSLLDFGSTSNKPNVSGLLVVSEGASDPSIQKKLLETISRVMQMPTHRIMIVPMESKGDEQ
ncbi:stage III sporulation protein AG [Ureibacillus xyleni]|uniref:Stage III sporulation protein AG n=1 Tax=Ureibacillus xyleni TaxID=614648 RepID=A0A285TT33_9BACL|nr:hypothetical protein [Ureibacillus xyleni]SOC27157.1 stage III sporulation protein AG [Ureibacillus xyleni]